MFKKIATAVLSLSALAVYMPAHANPKSCFVEVAVDDSVRMDQNVSFNINDDQGTARSATLPGGSAPTRIDNLMCSDSVYNVSATLYNTFANGIMAGTPIGQCILKYQNGQIYLRTPGSNISVVFPNDFIC